MGRSASRFRTRKASRPRDRMGRAILWCGCTIPAVLWSLVAAAECVYARIWSSRPKLRRWAMDEPAQRSTAFHTDQYEIGNLQGALESGVANRRAVFEVFARGLPPGRRYGVFAGLGRILTGLAEFRFTDEQLQWLERTGVA